jgi:uncharacterized secreted protein with C-terminal beta-propeller domain
MKNPSNLIVAVVLVACVSSFGMLAYVGHDLGAGGRADMLSTFPSYSSLRSFLKSEKASQVGEGNQYAPALTPNKEVGMGTGGALYSQTNVQVAGVDEEDFVKSDGTYIYISSYSRVTIVQAYPPSEMRNVSVIDARDVISDEKGNLSVSIQGMYVSNGTLVVLATAYESYYWYDTAYSKGTNPVNQLGPRSVVAVFDVVNPYKPRLSSEFGVSGNELTSRMVGDVVYLVTQSYAWSYGSEPTLPLTWVGDSCNELSVDKIRYDPETREASGFVNVLAVNLNSGDHDCISIVAGFASTIYMSPDALYLTMGKWNGPRLSIEGVASEPADSSRTTIYRISVDGVRMTATARGDVTGWLLNQFSMDERGQYLRVVTTTDWSDSKNNVYVLGPSLAVIGALEGLAPSERIYSSRFVGDSLYLVTFRQIDPLFVIDLSRPTSPKVLGELEMPGFSNYLQSIDDTHLFGIGSENGSVKISLYDVSDPMNPKETSKYLVDGYYSYSDAQWDHKAVLFDRQRELLVIPVSSYSFSSNGSPSEQGALVLRVSTENGISLRGIIAHTSEPSWYWSSAVQRSLYIGDHLYTVSQVELKANNINDLSDEGSLIYYVPPWIYPVTLIRSGAAAP